MVPPDIGAIVALAHPIDATYGISVGDLGVVKRPPSEQDGIGVEFAGSGLLLDPGYVREIKHLKVDGFVCSAINWQSLIKAGDVGIVRRVCSGDYDRHGVRRVEVDFGHGLTLSLLPNQTRAAPLVFGSIGDTVYSTIAWNSVKEGDRGTVKGLSSDRKARDRVEVKFDSYPRPINMTEAMLRRSNPPSRPSPSPPSSSSLAVALAEVQSSMANLMNNSSTNSLGELRTEDVTLISHTHGRERRAERNILRRELQAAIKYGTKERANPGRDGSLRWRFTYDGVVYITDETCRHEVTSWRIDGNDEEAVALAEIELAGRGCHAVLIVDNSGSMRTKDVGHQTRAEAVYNSLVRDFIKEQIKTGAAEDVVVTLISMSNDATVIVKAHPLDHKLIAHIEKMKTRRPRSHGNYIPALDKALEVMTEDAPNRGSVLLLMFSDGAPSDQQFMECDHHVQVFEIDRKEDPKMQHKSKASAWACRRGLHAKVKRECLDRVKQIGQVFGRDRVVSRMIGFGPPKEDFRLLSEMAAVLPRGEFQKLGLNTRNLKTAFSSLNSSMTDLRTAGGGSMLTPREDKVVDKNQFIDLSQTTILGREGWWIYSHAEFLGKYKVELEDGVAKLTKVSLGRGATGLAFVSQPFAEGAERFVYRCTEIEIPVGYAASWYETARDKASMKALRASSGLRLVAKEAKVVENLQKGRLFHQTFSRIQLEAAEQAKRFSERLPLNSPDMWKVSFLPTYLYCCKEENYSSGKCWVLAEPELDGKFHKWNNNAGAVRASTASQSAQMNQGAMQSLALIEESDEDEDEEEGFGPIEVEDVPQAFSHFTYEHSGGKCLVCDLQGVWNADDGYVLTDPVVHHVSRSGKKHKNGATDKGLAGVQKFFDTHRCNALCRKMGLKERSKDTLIKFR